MRTCVEPGCTVELEKPERGRPPVRCPEHRAARRHRKAPETPGSGAVGKRPRLRVVADAPPPTTAPERRPVADVIDDALSLPGDLAGEDVLQQVPALLATLRTDLQGFDSDHPLAASLAAGAERLAWLFESPLAAVDPRVAAALWKEIRATLAELVRVEAADDADDLFGDLSAPVVVTA